MYHTHTLQKNPEIYDGREMKSRRHFLHGAKKISDTARHLHNEGLKKTPQLYYCLHFAAINFSSCRDCALREQSGE
jgi:hypothetical protein